MWCMHGNRATAAAGMAPSAMGVTRLALAAVSRRRGLERIVRRRIGLAALAAALLIGCAARQPVHQLAVRGQVQSLATSGAALVGEFAAGDTYVWDWGDLRKPPRAYAREAVRAAMLGPRYRICQVAADSQDAQPVVAAREQPSGRVVRTWSFHAGWYCSEFCSSPDGRFAGIVLEESRPAGGDTCIGVIGQGTVEIPWVTVPGRVVRTAEDGMAIANTGRHVALLGLGDIRMLTVVDLSGRRVLWQRLAPQARSVAFSADGSIVYVGGYYGIHALQTASGQLVDTWSAKPGKGVDAPVTRVATSPDGRFVAVGTDLPDGQMYLLDGRTGSRVARWAVVSKHDGGGSGVSLRAKKTAIQGLAFSPGGRLLATADSLSGSVRIWEVPQESSGKGR